MIMALIIFTVYGLTITIILETKQVPIRTPVYAVVFAAKSLGPGIILSHQVVLHCIQHLHLTAVIGTHRARDGQQHQEQDEHAGIYPDLYFIPN